MEPECFWTQVEARANKDALYIVFGNWAKKSGGMAGVGIQVTRPALELCLIFTSFSFQFWAQIVITSPECMTYYSMLERHFFFFLVSLFFLSISLSCVIVLQE